MKFLYIIVLLMLIFSMVDPAVCAEGKPKIRNADGSERIKDTTPKKVISLDDAKAQNKDYEDKGIIDKGSSKDKDDASSKEESFGFETVESSDVIKNEVAAGNKQFVTDLVNGLYSGLRENDNEDDENVIENTYRILTEEPRPYDDKNIVELYGGYLNLALYIIVIFILGESISRNMDRMDISFGTKFHLPRRKFLGGIALCGLSMMGHVLFKLALDLIGTFNSYIITPVIPSITPDPENIIIFLLLGLCELLVGIFFKVRYYLVYVFAVICSVIIVLLVPKITRGFAVDVLEKMARILMMQPAALFVMSICVMVGDSSILGYVGLVVLIFLTCYYCMFGNFTLLKTVFSMAISKGLVKSGVRLK